MIAAGSRVTATVRGGWGYWTGTADGEEGEVADALGRFATVVSLSIRRDWFGTDYSAVVALTLKVAVPSWSEVNDRIAGAFQEVMNSRPAVSIAEAGDVQVSTPSIVPAPPWGTLAQWGLVLGLGIAAIVWLPQVLRER